MISTRYRVATAFTLIVAGIVVAIIGYLGVSKETEVAFQLPYFARHFRVLTFDGRGNGRSDRPLEPAEDARFAAGDGVRVRRSRPPGHSRCPRYLRGARGTIMRVHGRDGVPDVGEVPVPHGPLSLSGRQPSSPEGLRCRWCRRPRPTRRPGSFASRR